VIEHHDLVDHRELEMGRRSSNRDAAVLGEEDDQEAMATRARGGAACAQTPTVTWATSSTATGFRLACDGRQTEEQRGLGQGREGDLAARAHALELDPVSSAAITVEKRASARGTRTEGGPPKGHEAGHEGQRARDDDRRQSDHGPPTPSWSSGCTRHPFAILRSRGRAEQRLAARPRSRPSSGDHPSRNGARPRASSSGSTDPRLMAPQLPDQEQRAA